MRQTLLYSLLLIAALVQETSLQAQDSLWRQQPVLNFSGYVDIYYVFDANRPQGSQRQPFLYNHNRHNQISLNNGIFKFSLVHPKYRANFGVQAGTYVADNYANEPLALKFISEANIGLSLNKKNTLWLDAGIMPSHIGFESAVSMDNLTLTRSLLAENSPYFHAAVRLAYAPSAKLSASLLLLNGWQRIQRQPNNSSPAFGSQLAYTFAKGTLLNWSTFVGADTPDTNRLVRVFNNFYVQGNLSPRLKYVLGFDFGLQQARPRSNRYDAWFSPLAILAYQWQPQWRLAARAEYYKDQHRLLTAPENGRALRALSASLNIDYLPSDKIACRLEARYYHNQDPIFVQPNGSFQTNNLSIALSIAARLAS